MTYDSHVNGRRSIRLPTYDYGQVGAYFVTICAYRRECLFVHPAYDRLLLRVWVRTVCGGHYPPEGEFVVMPNHVHGIVWIRDGRTSSGASYVGASRPFRRNDVSDRNRVPRREGHLASVDGSPLRVARPITSRHAERGSLGALIASFKTQSTIAINRLRRSPGEQVWQRNYYEHIIRNEKDLHRIREYIRDNPAKWDEDPDNPVNL